MNLQYVNYFFRITELLRICETFALEGIKFTGIFLGERVQICESFALEGIKFNGIFWGKRVRRTLKYQNIKSPNPLMICQGSLAVKALMEGRVYLSDRRIVLFV